MVQRGGYGYCRPDKTDETDRLKVKSRCDANPSCARALYHGPFFRASEEAFCLGAAVDVLYATR